MIQSEKKSTKVFEKTFRKQIVVVWNRWIQNPYLRISYRKFESNEYFSNKW